MTTKLPELLPCPFCGSPAEYASRTEHTHISASEAIHSGLGYSAGSISNTTHKVHCTAPWTCYASVVGQSEADAIALWNTRATAPAEVATPCAWQQETPYGIGYTFTEAFVAHLDKMMADSPAPGRDGFVPVPVEPTEGEAMNLEQAKAILARTDEYVAHVPGQTTACLDGRFTADQLEATAVWMRNRTHESDSTPPPKGEAHGS